MKIQNYRSDQMPRRAIEVPLPIVYITLPVYVVCSLQKLALSNLPENLRSLKAFSSTPRRSYSNSTTESGGGPTDAFALELVRWFRSSFMTWTDPMPCTRCGESGSHAMEAIGSTEPSEKERSEGGAGRVELWKCTKLECGVVERFPRYK